VPLDAGRE
jgi:hypothetical protein